MCLAPPQKERKIFFSKNVEQVFITEAFQIRGERFSNERLESALEIILFLPVNRELLLMLLPAWGSVI